MSFFNPEAFMSEEEKLELKETQKRLVMKYEETMARIKRLIAEELSYEQLEALDALLSHIANAQNPATVANWYEGQTTGALAVRDIVCGEKPLEIPEP